MSDRKSLSVAIISSAVTSAIVSGVIVWNISHHLSPAWSLSPVATTNPGAAVPSAGNDTIIIGTVKKTEPSVVSVIISKNLPVLQQNFNDPFGGLFGSPFDNQLPQSAPKQNGTQKQQIGGGTAFFVSADGLLMTNKHVVEDEQADYTVLLNDGNKVPAKVVARDPANDIALLKIEGSGYTPLTFSIEDPQLGQAVIAIGNALGEFRNTVSVGVVSGLSRKITAGSPLGNQTERIERIIQTDAAINEGNSGGPLLDIQGQVIGMNTAVAQQAQNIGFALPAKDLKRALDLYQKNGRIVRPYLGVRYLPITKDVQDKNGLKYDYGALVVKGDLPGDLAVIPGSPADKAGIQENDIILEIDGQKLTDAVSLSSIVQAKSPGDTLKLKVSRKGQERDVDVKLEEKK